MNSSDEEELERVLKRAYATFAKEEVLDAEDLQLLRRANAAYDDVENTLFAIGNELDELRKRLTIHSEMDPNQRGRNRRDDKTYINCWRIGEDESAVFWNAYLGQEPGVAIETTVGRTPYRCEGNRIPTGRVTPLNEGG